MKHRIYAALVASFVGLLPFQAGAGLTQADIAGAAVHAKAGSQLPLEARFTKRNGDAVSLGRAIGGRPSVLVFADLTCKTLCGVTLRAVGAALQKIPSRVGKDYSLIVASIDPKDKAADANHMAGEALGQGPLAQSAVFLLGGDVANVAKAAGYSYSYDKQNDAYAHPIGLYLLTPQGRISKYISGLGFAPKDLAAAIDKAGAEQISPIVQTVFLLCYQFDPVTGVYTADVNRIMAFVGVGFAAILLMVLGFFHFRLRRMRRSS